MKNLILVEKNSFAREFIKALKLETTKNPIKSNSATFYECINKDKDIFYILSSGGHITYTEFLDFSKIEIDQIPIIPTELKQHILSERKEALNEAKKISTQINKCYHFGDCGQEGQIIQDNIIKILNLDKKNIFRAWYSEITPNAINKSFQNAKNILAEQFKNLGDAGQLRRLTDYIVGLNLSYLFKSAIGRVKTPIVFVVRNRTNEHKNHIKTPFWYLNIKTTIKLLELKLKSENQDENIFKNIENNYSLILETNKKIKEINPPKLFNLNTLQEKMGKQYSPKQTLEIVQKLYEKGIITYPRTDEEKITQTTENLVIIENIYKNYSEEKNYKDIFSININDNRIFLKKDEVTDHTAIIPTEKSYKIKNELEDTENKIFEIIKKRFISALSKNAITKILELKSKVNIKINENKLEKEIILKGEIKTIKDEGFLKYEKNKEYIEIELFEKIRKILEEKYKNNQKLNFITEIKKDYKKPKPLFNYTSIINWLDTNNIGTPATRGSILDQCITKEYLEITQDKKKKIIITEKGETYCKKISETDSKEITTPSFTNKMEIELKKIREGKTTKNNYFENFREEIQKICKDIIQNNNTEETKFNCIDKNCNKKLIQGEKGIYCKDHIFLPKIFAKTNIEQYFETLLAKKETNKIKFTSKKEKEFSASLKLNEENKLKFIFEPNNYSAEETQFKCVNKNCNKKLIQGEKGIYCKDHIFLPKIFAKTNIEKFFETLLDKKETDKIKFISNKGKAFFASLKLNKENKLEFIFE